jgi:hypothetical protein
VMMHWSPSEGEEGAGLGANSTTHSLGLEPFVIGRVSLASPCHFGCFRRVPRGRSGRAPGLLQEAHGIYTNGIQPAGNVLP